MYKLTSDAEKDLEEVAHYTLHKWGKDLLSEYNEGLQIHFEGIAKGSIQKRPVIKAFPELYVSKYRYHYIFFLKKDSVKIIIGVIHEKRDIVSRLKERLG